MARNSTGNYTVPAAYNPVIADTTITTLWANTTMSDLATAMTDSLDRQGRGAMLAPLKLVDGTLALPALAFSNDSTAGFVRLAAGEFSAAIGGVEAFTVKAANVEFLTIANFARAKTTYTPTAADDLVRKDYADNLSFSTTLPAQAGNARKIVRTDGATASWQDPMGPLTPLTSTTTLVARNSYSIDSSGGSFNLNLPALVVDDWINIVDVAGSAVANPVLLVRNGADEIMNLAEDMSFNVAYASIQLRGTSTRGWVIV